MKSGILLTALVVILMGNVWLNYTQRTRLATCNAELTEADQSCEWKLDSLQQCDAARHEARTEVKVLRNRLELHHD